MGELDPRAALVVGPRLTTVPIAEALIETGCSVVLGDTSVSDLGLPLPAERGWAAAFDATTPEGQATLVSSARVELGRLDVLVLHPETHTRGLVTQLDLEAWQRDLDQLAMAFTIARDFARAAEPNAALVFLASLDLSQSYPERATAATVSNGLVGLARTLAVEWAVTPIRVNVVALGVVLSPEETEATERGDRSLDRVLLRAPGHRLGDVVEVAAVVRFLVGPGAEFITGQTIWVDGGWAALTQHAEGLRFP